LRVTRVLNLGMGWIWCEFNGFVFSDFGIGVGMR